MSNTLSFALPNETNPREDISIVNDHVVPILTMIGQNPVTNVVSGSGVGKTTKLPVKIAENNNRIMVVVSNDSVANSLQNFVSTKTQLRVGNTINGPEPIKYVSQDTLKEYLYNVVRDKKCLDLDMSDILMIDEADQESYNQYMIGAIWRYCAEHQAKVPRLLLSSNVALESDLYDVSLYHIDTNRHKPDIRYTTQDYPLHSYNRVDTLIPDTIDLVYDIVNSGDEGDILVFTPSITTVGLFIEQLERLKMKNVNIYPAHEGLSKGEVDRIYQPDDGRKIIVADKAAETTFGVDTVTIVVDMMNDYKNFSSKTGGRRYDKKFISKAQANQRCSRGGKICYRMVTQTTFNKLPEFEKSEIERVPLYFVMMELIDNGLQPYDILSGFDKNNLDYSYGLMIRLGIIDALGRISEIGKFIQMFPYGIRQGVALYHWVKKEYPIYPAVVLLSMIDIFNRSYFVYPVKTEEQSQALYNMETINHRAEYFTPFSGPSDIHTYGHIWNTMIDEVGSDSVLTDISQWCEDNYIYLPNMLEVITLNRMVLAQIETMVSDPIEKGVFDTDSLVDLLGPILIEVYQDRQLVLDPTNGSRARYQDSNGSYYKIDTVYSVNNIEIDRPEIIYGLIISIIESKVSSDFRTVPVSLIL